eukprot:6977476-Pyramimonas_sp.AAC.1
MDHKHARQVEQFRWIGISVFPRTVLAQSCYSQSGNTNLFIGAVNGQVMCAPEPDTSGDERTRGSDQ